MTTPVSPIPTTNEGSAAVTPSAVSGERTPDWPECLRGDVELLREKAAAYDRINTPEVDDFLSAVRNEALHQRERWSVDHDGGKEASDWFWLVGYLAGKALHDVKGKRLHHIITAAAALLNWHGQATGNYAAMRPGIEPPACTTCGGTYGLTPRCPGCAND